MRVALIGGTFNTDGGKASDLVMEIADNLEEHDLVANFGAMNGGHIQDLLTEYEQGESMLCDADVVMWCVDVPEEYKDGWDFKSKYPEKVVLTSVSDLGEKGLDHLLEEALKYRR